LFWDSKPSQPSLAQRVRRPLGISDSRLASAPVRLSDPGPETQLSPPETDEKKSGKPKFRAIPPKKIKEIVRK